MEPQAASEWVATFEPGPDRDSAVTGLIGRIKGDDPEAAFTWATSIESNKQRNAQVRETIDQWRVIDEAAARSAVEAAELDEGLREDLLQRIDGEDAPPPSQPSPFDSDPFAADDPFG